MSRELVRGGTLLFCTDEEKATYRVGQFLKRDGVWLQVRGIHDCVDLRPARPPNLPWHVLRSFLIGIRARHKGLGYGYVHNIASKHFPADFDAMRAGHRFWGFWRRPIRNGVIAWKLRNL